MRQAPKTRDVLETRGLLALGLGLGLLATTGAGCAASRPPPPASPVGPRDWAHDAVRGLAPPVAMRFEHVAERDAFRVTYEFSTPRATVSFSRKGYPDRVERWHVVEGDVAWSSPDELRPTNGRPIARFTLEVASYEQQLEKDYSLFLPYGDGGRLVYTGHFLTAFGGREGTERIDDVTRITFVPRAGEHLIALGEVRPGAFVWDTPHDDTRNGTYAYFGNTQPGVGDGFVGVVDAAMPAWLHDPIVALLPPLFRFYKERTGLALDFKPVVFMSYGNDPTPKSFSFGGGTLPGIVQLDVRLGPGHGGAGDAMVRERTEHLVAHEIAHLWNGQLVHPSGASESAGGSWMHEGGADAFAERALIALGKVTPAHVQSLRAEATSRCLVGLGLGPVHQAMRAGRSKLFYACGSLLAELTELAGKGAEPPVDLFHFWGSLAKDAPNGAYDESQYFAHLRAFPQGQRTIELARDILDGTGDPITPLLERAPALGMRPQTTAQGSRPAPLPDTYESFAGMVALTLALRGVCHEEEPALVEGRAGNLSGFSLASRCAAFEGALFTAIEGVNLRRHGAAAYDRLHEACGRGETTLEMRTREGKLSTLPLPCGDGVPPRPPFLVPAP